MASIPSTILRALLALGCLLPSAAVAETHTTATHRFEEIAPGVFFVTEVGEIYLMSNALVVVNDSDVLVVDSHVTPMAGRALLASIATFTDKPVTTLINSHYHFDHAHGNQAFGPDVEVIGHEFTRQKLSGTPLEELTYLSFMKSFEDRLAGLKTQLAEADESARAALEKQVTYIGTFLEAQRELQPRAPDLTLSDRMTLFRGSREIQVHFLGRGHTGGDVVVLLPAEGVLFTGDLLLPFLSYMGDGHVDEWGTTLANLNQLEFTTIVPGHGRPFTDRAQIVRLQEYYQDLWSEVVALRKSGVSAAEAALRVDLTRHSELGVREPGSDPRAVLRIYQLLDERGE